MSLSVRAPVACGAVPEIATRRLFDVDIGMQWQHGGVDANLHCGELCAGMSGCIHCTLLHRGSPPRGAIGTCVLYGDAEEGKAGLTAAPAPKDTVTLLRSDAHKLEWLTRCHAEYVSILRSQLAGAASLELLVDVTALYPPDRASDAIAAASRRVEGQLRDALGVDAFAYVVEDFWAAFPAVRHWPSPQDHDASRNKLRGGDVVKIWWKKVLKRHRQALGPDVARRLTAYLIHEPSLVLWARARKAAGKAIPEHTWVIEDDAVFMGSLGDLMRAPAIPMAPAPAGTAACVGCADLVSTFDNLVGQQIEASSHDWKANSAFAALYANRRVHKWEHVERFSARLILRLDELLSEQGAAAHGEMFASTVCLAEPWCAAFDMRLAQVVDSESRLYGPSDSVLHASTRQTRRRLYKRARAKGAPGLWLHAVKDYCNALAIASNETVRVSPDDPERPFIISHLGAEDSPLPGVPAARTCSAADRDAADRDTAGEDHECEGVSEVNQWCQDD